MRNKVIVIGLVGILGLTGVMSTANATYDNKLAPTVYTPANYVRPQYDAFDSNFKFQELPLNTASNSLDTPPVADFIVTNQQIGLQNNDSGTTKTAFIFNAAGSTDQNTKAGRLQSRWDFDGDGKMDTYFSTTMVVKHTYEKAGNYRVELQVLDGAGNVAKAWKNLQVVEPTDPVAIFTARPDSATMAMIFNFNTEKSYSDQFAKSALKYRFDWDSDGKWETNFESKTNWFHRFEATGQFRVTMETVDPLKNTAQAELVVNVIENTAPHAAFGIDSVANSKGKVFRMNANGSSDAETAKEKLRFRWDFDYHGPNDIIYDTPWIMSSSYSIAYRSGGQKVIKLEVMDEDGAIDITFAAIAVAE